MSSSKYFIGNLYFNATKGYLQFSDIFFTEIMSFSLHFDHDTYGTITMHQNDLNIRAQESFMVLLVCNLVHSSFPQQCMVKISVGYCFFSFTSVYISSFVFCVWNCLGVMCSL